MTSENTTADVQIMMGGSAHLSMGNTPGRKGSLVVDDRMADELDQPYASNYKDAPTEEETHTLRRVAGAIPLVAYVLCAVEFAERASYYGVQPLFSNFVNRPLPAGGSGTGAPTAGTQQTAGALGLGLSKANAVSQSFSLLAYALPMLFGWIADVYTGRFKIICWGVAVCGVAHVLMVGAAAPSLLQAGTAAAPFLLSVYILAIGAAMFKPNISPTLLDQMPVRKPVTKTLASGERVIEDPEATTERVMLWFYLLINIGGFMGVPTAYSAKDVGYWLAFLLPLILYLPLLPLLFWLRKRLILHPPGGSDLGNCFRVLFLCLKRGSLWRIGRADFFEPAKPSVIAASGNHVDVPWNDNFVDDVHRTFQATGIFCFFPIQYVNDNGLGQAASGLSTMLVTNGVPNDVLGNWNSLSIIVFAPLLNYGLYPLLRKYNIHFGSIAQITFGFFLSTCGGIAYTVLNYYAYKGSPCGEYGSSDPTCVDNGLVADISIWWMAIPYALGGISELFVNVPAYGIAYSRAPKNMRGLVSAINLFNTAIAYALGLAFSALIQDPYLTWDFGGPAIVGFASAILFYWLYRHLDQEEYRMSNNDTVDNYAIAHPEIEPADNYGAEKVSSTDSPSNGAARKEVI